jgi:DNA-binding HxlR family transcriptional regulator
MAGMTTTISDREKDSAPLIDDETCRLFRAAAELAGQKWTAAVLLAMASGADRFSVIRSLVDGVSDRILSARLKDLEHQKLLERQVVPTTPVQVRYTLTQQGRELITILQPLVSWGMRWKLRPSD